MHKIIGMLFLASLVFFGCNQDLDDPISQTGETKVVVPIKIQDQHVSARTVMPEVSLDDVAQYELVCTEVGKEDVIDSWTFTAAEMKNASIELAAGTTRDFELYAYKAGSSQEYLWGGIYKKTISGSGDTLNFVLGTPYWIEGKGNVQVIIEPLDPRIASAGVQLEESEIPLSIKDGRIVYEAELDAGYYAPWFRLKNGSGQVVLVFSETIWVRPGLTSKKTITLPPWDNTSDLPGETLDIDADILARCNYANDFDLQRYKNAVQYLTEDDKIYLYRALDYEPNMRVFWDVLKTYTVSFNNNTIPLKDFYVKPRRESDFFYFDRFISYDKVTLPSGSYYPAKEDSKNGYFSASYPSEADRGGMNANFVEYDYVLQYKYEKSIPAELKPIIEVAKAIGANVDYDFAKAYNVACKIKSGQTGGICDDYADITADRLRQANIAGISKIYKVSSSEMNHAWVELELNGKPVYVDTTWFDINAIWGREGFNPADYGVDNSWLGYSISTPQELRMDWDYLYVTYDLDLFNKGYSGKKYSHYLGGDAEKTVVWEQ